MSKKIHFIGIGGIGMSGLARLYLHDGATVSGSDAVETELTRTLTKEGIQVTYKQVAENISDDIDLVVYTEAMSADHPEVVAAKEKGIKTVNYFEALGEIANEYYLIAVAGTHGKTTTTAMIIDILEEASMDPTAIVGSLRSKTNSNYRAGKSKYFVVEACEYRRDFLTLEPDVLIVTNLEHEHVDYYKTLEDVQAAFRELAAKVPEDGVVVVDTSDVNVQPVLSDLNAEVIDYRPAIDPSLTLHQPGLHNYRNAAAAAATASWLGVQSETIVTALENFAGTKRRFEYKGMIDGVVPIYDDYAHHPTEIRAAINGVREKYPQKSVTVIFQPHTFSRTKELFDDFAAALSTADKAVLVPIYAAREENTSGISSEQLTGHIPGATYFHTFEAAALAVKEAARDGEVVMVMGAGDVTKLGNMLVG